MLVVNLLLRDISYFKRDCFILTESLYGTEGPDVEEFGPRFANVDITRSSVIRDLSPSEVEQLSEHLNRNIPIFEQHRNQQFIHQLRVKLSCR